MFNKLIPAERDCFQLLLQVPEVVMHRHETAGFKKPLPFFNALFEADNGIEPSAQIMSKLFSGKSMLFIDLL